MDTQLSNLFNILTESKKKSYILQDDTKVFQQSNMLIPHNCENDLVSIHNEFIKKCLSIIKIEKKLLKTNPIPVKKQLKQNKVREVHEVRDKKIDNFKKIINNILSFLKSKTKIKWCYVESGYSSYLLHTILSIIDEVYSLSKPTQQNKYIQQVREQIAIAITKECIGSKVKLQAHKQFPVSSLQQYVHNYKKFNSLLDQILPYLYSEYFGVNIIHVNTTNISYLSTYSEKRVSILVGNTNDFYYGFIPEEQKHNWITPDIVKDLVNTQTLNLLTLHTQKSKLPKKKIESKKFKLKGFSTYKLGDLQRLAKEFSIPIWKMAETREKIYQKNVSVRKRKSAEMKTKTKNRTKRELYEALKNKINEMNI